VACCHALAGKDVHYRYTYRRDDRIESAAQTAACDHPKHGSEIFNDLQGVTGAITMSEQDLRSVIKSRLEEFVPVRVHLSNGTHYDVRFPEAILIGRTASAILVEGQINLIGNMHINRIEPLVTAA
jgi:hypothetical protein